MAPLYFLRIFCLFDYKLKKDKFGKRRKKCYFLANYKKQKKGERVMCNWRLYFFIFFWGLSFSINTDAKVKNTKKEYVLQLYQLAKDTHEIFVKHGVEYWIFAGTMLGAVRHKGLIPWDDDIDVEVFLDQKELILSLRPVFEDAGYVLFEENYGLFRVFSQNGTSLPGYKYKFPYLDIFFVVEKNEKIYFHLPTWRRRQGEPIYITKKELYPLKEYVFGEITLYGPNDPINHFIYSYGRDWNTVAVKVNHLSQGKERIRLKKEDRVPAQPIGPLEDRIQ